MTRKSEASCAGEASGGPLTVEKFAQRRPIRPILGGFLDSQRTLDIGPLSRVLSDCEDTSISDGHLCRCFDGMLAA